MRKNLSLFKQIKIALGLVIITALLVVFTNVQSLAVFTNFELKSNLTKLPQYQADIKIEQGEREKGSIKFFTSIQDKFDLTLSLRTSLSLLRRGKESKVLNVFDSTNNISQNPSLPLCDRRLGRHPHHRHPLHSKLQSRRQDPLRSGRRHQRRPRLRLARRHRPSSLLQTSHHARHHQSFRIEITRERVLEIITLDNRRQFLLVLYGFSLPLLLSAIGILSWLFLSSNRNILFNADFIFFLIPLFTGAISWVVYQIRQKLK